MSTKFTRSYFFRKNIHPLLAKLPGYDYWLLYKKSPLRTWGWFRSFRENRSVDAAGRPIPWITYPAIDLLEQRLPADASVFEYGSGLGTLWWAERVGRITAVEHSRKWAEMVEKKLPDNATLIVRDIEKGYEKSILESGEMYDLIIIDGRRRAGCVSYSLQALTERGVILFDDSAREKYGEGLQRLRENGFRQLPLRGFSPIEFLPCETSIFYRDGNCLGL
ncbi:MAG: class I SAM-dependent methyltransferase [Balneolaceae bacterium]